MDLPWFDLNFRLPIMQSSSFAFLSVFIAWRNTLCPDGQPNVNEGGGADNLATVVSNVTTGPEALTSSATAEGTPPWQTVMSLASGGVMLSAVLEMLLGCTGAIGLLTQYIGPLTLCPTLFLISLSLFSAVSVQAQEHWGVALLTVAVFIVCASFLSSVNIPIPGCTRSSGFHIVNRYPLFRLFPQGLAIAVGWIVCLILTKTSQLPTDSTQRGYRARTDINLHIIEQQNWFFVPYPGMWGFPTFSFSMFTAMLASTTASILESIGDYYAAARACCEPAPPKHAINRGIAAEGLGGILCGLLGAGHSTTSYSGPTALIAITGMASRYAFICAGVIILLAGMFGKFGAVLSCIPPPVLAGDSMVTCAMVMGLGLSYLSAVDLHSTRNLLITGMALFFGVMIPAWMAKNPTIIQTGFPQLDQTLTMTLSTSMFVGGVLAFLLDNILPGTLAERGLDHHATKDTSSSSDRIHIYDLPLSDRCSACYNNSFLTYLPLLPCYVERQFPLQCKTVRSWINNTLRQRDSRVAQLEDVKTDQALKPENE